VLDQEDSILICIGYSFSDEHINSVIFDALAARPRVHVYGLQFDEVAIGSHVAKASESLKNLLVLGPDTGIVGGQQCPWKLIDEIGVPPGDYMSVAFAVAEAKKGEAEFLSGKFKLGAFDAFTEFLNTLTEH
jgi:hypothetical protein